MGNHHSHDATLKEFSIDTQTVVATQDDSWDLYNGLHHAAPVSVFVAKKATSTVDTFAQVSSSGTQLKIPVEQCFFFAELAAIQTP